MKAIFETVESHLQNKQVYFRKEIANVDLQTIAEARKVHNVGRVSVQRIDVERFALDIEINGKETTIYQYMSRDEFFEWVWDNFIPVSELAISHLISNQNVKS